MGCGAQSGLPRPRSCSSPPVRVGPKPRTGKASRTASRSRYRHFSAHQACIIIIILTNLSSFHFLFHFVFIFYLFIYIYFFKREKCLKRIWAKKQVKLTRAPNSLWCVREARSPQGRICPCSPRSWRVARGWGVSRCYGATPKPLLKPPPPCQSPPCLADASPCAALQCKTETVWGSTNFPAFCSGAPEELRTRRVPGGPRGPVPIPGRGGGGAGISVFRGCLKHFCSEMQRLGVVLRGYRLDKPPFSQIPKLVFLSFTLGASLPFYHSSITLGAAIIYLDRLKVYLFGNCLVS